MRTLVLKKETLAELAADDLRNVVGANSTAIVRTIAASLCTGDPLSFGCQSWHTEEC